jgi:hypothetical protein
MPVVTVTLKVAPADEDDVYRDIARINVKHRAGLLTGQVYLVQVGATKRYMILRGTLKEDTVLLDEKSRSALKVKSGQSTELQISEAGSLGYLIWCWRATDPQFRIPAQLGILSFGLGLLSLFLSLIPLVSWWQCK